MISSGARGRAKGRGMSNGGGVRIALAQINPTVGDLDGNAALMLEYVERARAADADLVAFPELAVTGYPPEDLLLKPQFLDETRRAVERVSRASDGIAIIAGFVESAASKVYNAAAIAWGGEIVGTYRKRYLPNYGVFDEDRYFDQGEDCPVYLIGGAPVGVNICEDIWYPAGPAAVQRAAGAEIIVNINGSPFSVGKRRFREKMLATRAADNGVFLAYLNMVGGQDELVFDGASAVFDPAGDVVARAAQFDEELLIADLDVGAARRRRLKEPRARKEDRADVPPASGESLGRGAPIVPVSERRGDAPPRAPAARRIADHCDGAEEVYRALTLGTRDYVRKCGFSKTLVAISGGIDSALVAAIAADALGRENVVGVAMPSRYSSEGSLTDARLLADNLGVELWTIPIEGVFAAFDDALAPKFAGTEWGVAEENVQSRIRGNMLMALSNKFGWLALTTGNKSEMATGYATIYGDMSGGFAVIKDVPKTMCYDLARRRNAAAGFDLIPAAILDKPPSAELRPDQRDDDSLPPYEILDPLLKAYVEDDMGFDEMLAICGDAETVRRTIALVDRSEYKRRQSAPGVKITPRNFGRDRRMPIANRWRAY